MVWEVFFSSAVSSYDRSCGAGKSSCSGKLLALAKFAGELDHNKHGELLLSLRGTEFASEECRVLSFTCFDKTMTDGLSAIPTRLRLVRGGFERSLLAGQISLNSGPDFRPTLLIVPNGQRS